MPTTRDIRTSPIIDAIFEQIICDAARRENLVESSDLTCEPDEEQVIGEPSPAQLSDHERNLHRLSVIQKTAREQERAPKPAKVKHKRWRQPIHTAFVDFQNTHCHQQQVSSARERTSHADRLSVEAEQKRPKPLLSTLDAPDRKRLGRGETVATAKARGAEVEATTSKFHSDINAAIDRTRNLQARLNNLGKLTSRKRHLIQPIAEESPVEQTNPEGAEDGTPRLGAELPRKHDHRVRERKELLDERVRMKDTREPETHLGASGAQDGQGKPVALRQVQSRIRSRRPSSLDSVHLPLCQSPATEPVDTGQPLLPPAQIPDACTRPICPALESGSSLSSTKAPRDPSDHDWGGRSSRYIEDQLLISAPFDPESEVARSSRAALEELIELMRQPESKSAQDVKPTKPNDRHLEEELASTAEQLRFVKQEVLILRRDLDCCREQAWNVENCARDLENDCHARLRESEDARRVNESKFAQVAEQLRLRNAELESSRAEAEASQFQCSQNMFLSAAQQERIHGLEAEVKTLKGAQNTSARIVVPTDSRPFVPTNTGMGLLWST